MSNEWFSGTDPVVGQTVIFANFISVWKYRGIDKDGKRKYTKDEECNMFFDESPRWRLWRDIKAGINYEDVLRRRGIAECPEVNEMVLVQAKGNYIFLMIYKGDDSDWTDVNAGVTRENIDGWWPLKYFSKIGE